jgi:hypothetical protein
MPVKRVLTAALKSDRGASVDWGNGPPQPVTTAAAVNSGTINKRLGRTASVSFLGEGTGN